MKKYASISENRYPEGKKVLEFLKKPIHNLRKRFHCIG